MTDVKWDMSTEDAHFSLIHIKSPEILRTTLTSSACKPSKDACSNLPVSIDSWIGNCRQISPMNVSQGSFLCVGVIVHPTDSVDSMESWSEKYKSLEVKVDIPSTYTAVDINAFKRADSPAPRPISIKHSFLGTTKDTYWLHVTSDIIVLPQHMLGKVLPLIAYVNPHPDSGKILERLILVGEIKVEEILGIDVNVNEHVANVKLSNRDGTSTVLITAYLHATTETLSVEIEDLIFSCSDYRLSDNMVPLILPPGKHTDLDLTSDHSRVQKGDDEYSLLVKWNIKIKNELKGSIWSTVKVTKA
ncbi:acriflavin resistance protein, putative [Babesia ovis]|uniref:Acriflavin resistance protein, putative n=1 Tax=Babesia ovis TaxID=5869 RepID=A0A9W5TB77_BABOV|nr:acriflavin resistance protein, putative [Babesia ovis]